jgi:hypothetical protein
MGIIIRVHDAKGRERMDLETRTYMSEKQIQMSENWIAPPRRERHRPPLCMHSARAAFGAQDHTYDDAATA